jgi:hypothetical protein
MHIGPKAFSWFIYRVTNPTLRNMFMEPRNFFRVKEALLSVLAGDLFGNTRIGGPLLIFKGFYYVTSIFNFNRTWKAWRMRRDNIRLADDSGATIH